MIDLTHRRLYHLRNFGHDGPFGNPVDGLGNNSQRLTHFLHADDVPIIRIAALPNWDFEIEVGVSSVGLRLADIPLHTASAQYGSRHAECDAVFCRDSSYTFGSFHPDAVGGEQFFVLANLRSHEVEELFYFAFESFIGFVETAADAECVRGEARSTVFLEDLENFFPVAEGVKE